MPNQFFSPEGDLEEYFATDYWLFEQYIGDQLWGMGDTEDVAIDVSGSTRRTPVQEFTSSTNWKQVSMGRNHAGGIKTDGTLWMWSTNTNGELGLNDNVQRLTPVQEFTSSINWKQVSCGANFTAAIKTDGTLWTWGSNSSGNLGVNDTNARSTPVQEFSSSATWKQVGCGDRHVLAIKTDGTLWAWGEGSSGRLGVNSTNDIYTPVQEFTSSTNWKSTILDGVSSQNYSAAIKTDGTLWLWGFNAYGNLGVNDTTNRLTPVQEFSSSTTWKQVDVGFYLTAAIKTDGTLWLWGRNNNGQLGVNDNIDRSTPVQEFTSSTNWKQVGCGYLHTAAIKTDGTLWGWGRNSNGPLGDNTLAARSTPRQEFTSSTNWKQVSGGNVTTLAIKTGIEIDTGTLT